jgi:acyl-CoA synthetase (AMP-forming)/AMP-acid ligase II
MTTSLVLLHDLLAGRDHDDDRHAITHGEQSVTYGTFKRQVELLARRLVAAGAKRGDRVAIFLPKSVDECVALFAASRADLVFVPVNPSLRPAQVRHIIEDCAASVVVSSADMLGTLGDALGGLPSLQAVVHVDTTEDAPPELVM